MLQTENNNILKQQGCVYLALNVVDWIDIFIRPVYKQVIVESLNYFIDKKGLTVYAWCLMTNHLHLMAESEDLHSLIADLKRFTSRLILEDIDVEPEPRKNWLLQKFRNENNGLKLQETFQIWQRDVCPTPVDLHDISAVKAQLHHIHCSPVRDRIVMLPEDYLYSSASDYAGIKGLVNIRLIAEKQEPDFLLRHLFSYRHIN